MHNLSWFVRAIIEQLSANADECECLVLSYPNFPPANRLSDAEKFIKNI